MYRFWFSKKYRFFTPFIIVLNLLFFERSVFGLTNITFKNNYAIFSPEADEVGFEFDKEVTILFLEKLEEPSLESSPFGLTIKYNHTRNKPVIDFTLYKKGTIKSTKGYNVDDKLNFKNLGLVWDMSDITRIQVMVKLSIAFIWEDNQESSPTNMTYIGFRTSSSLTIRQKDSFTWISDILTACSPQKNAEISCALNVNRLSSKSMSKRNNTSSREFRKVLEMKLIPEHSNPQYNYEVSRVRKTALEMTISANQTLDQTEPRLHIIRHNTTKLKMDTIVGPLNLSINIPSGNFTLGSNDSLPFLLWRDPVNKNNRSFEKINYVTVKVSESALSQSYTVDKSLANSCKLTCKSIKDSLPWYKRWLNSLKRAFPPDDDAANESQLHRV